MAITLQPTQTTVAKARLDAADNLADNEKFTVYADKSFDIQYFDVAEQGHYKVKLVEKHAELDTDEVFLFAAHFDGWGILAKALVNTVLKEKPVPTDELGPESKASVKEGTILQVDLERTGDIVYEKGHVKVALAEPIALQSGREVYTVWGFVGELNESKDDHWLVIGTEPGNLPIKQNEQEPIVVPENPQDLGKAMKFPGFEGTYYTNNPIIMKTTYGEKGHFTWGEATHNGSRIPENQDVVYGMIRIAEALEDIRHMYGRAMTINSWYRPPAINRAVGGASKSRHLNGDAVDFNVVGVNPHDVFARLNSWWGAKGGLASSSKFTHIDARGYRARWSYGY